MIGPILNGLDCREAYLTNALDYSFLIFKIVIFAWKISIVHENVVKTKLLRVCCTGIAIVLSIFHEPHHLGPIGLLCVAVRRRLDQYNSDN